jgi:hypothetical protein
LKDVFESFCGKRAKSDVFNVKNTREEVKHAACKTPVTNRTKKFSLARKSHEKTINIRKNIQAIPSQAAPLNFASSVAVMNFEVNQILLFASERNAPSSLAPFLASSAILPTFD